MSIAQTMPTTGPLVDPYQRVVKKLRVSLTDRCNFRCVYCMPEDTEFLPRDELLTVDEIVRAVTAFARLGVEKIRLTGGEPLMRPDVVEITRRIKQVPGVRSVSMTTNGFMLPHRAAELKAAGLDGVNISLDTLRRDRFLQLARRDYLDHVLRGIAAAIEHELQPVKINTVMMRGVNDQEVRDFLTWSREHPVVVRFIEFMPLDADNIWERKLVYTLSEIVEAANAIAPVDEITADKAAPARTFRFRDGKGEFGVIASVSEPFCEWCDRVRITAEGKIRNCLFATDETDLRELIRAGASDGDLDRRIRESVWSKGAGHLINQPGFVKPERTMHRIGG
ncbi:MAG: GTP 3',8-cyclase MoaA [Firmicutes bacterium]|nr:GTP 3',8-cyclase MoaA [Bacillota bacterium]